MGSKVEIDQNKGSLCFGCSQKNPYGLKLIFREENGAALSEFIAQEYHQGWSNVCHGGIIFSLLDEAGGYAVHYAGLNCVTAKSEIRFYKPTPIGEPIAIKAYLTKKTSRLVETEATLSLRDEEILASCHSLWYVLSEVGERKP